MNLVRAYIMTKDPYNHNRERFDRYNQLLKNY